MSRRVLIVDDEPNVVMSLEYLMRREGYEVDVATDGVAALDLMARQLPDVVVLDVMLPRMNGFDVCERIRSAPQWSGTKILMLTAKGRETEMAKGLAVGADVYMTKPFSTKELVTRVRELLAGA